MFGLMGALRVEDSVLGGCAPLGLAFHCRGKAVAGSAIYANTFDATWARFWKKFAVAVWPCCVVW